MKFVILYLITDIFAFFLAAYGLACLKGQKNSGITQFKAVIGFILLCSSAYLMGLITPILIVYFLTNVLGFGVIFAEIISVISVLFLYYLAYRISKRITPNNN